MRNLLRPWQLAVAVLLLAATVLTLAVSSRLTAQARAVVVLSTTLETPAVGWAVELLTREPRLEETTVAGAPTTLARPPGNGPWPTLVIVNGAAEQGRREPALQRLVRGLARAGYLVLLPDLPGLPRGELTERTVEATVAVARAAAARRDARDGRVGLVGVSVGTSLALLAAADPGLSRLVTVVAGTAPYSDLTNLLRLATTGYYREGNLLIRYETDGFLAVAVARSLAAALPAGPTRDALLAEAERLDDDATDPLAPVRTLAPSGLTPEARALVEVLANRDPRRFEELYAALSAELRDAIARLSPITAADRVLAPVELASAPQDVFAPVSESRAFADSAPDARVTVTETLGHAVPAPSLRDFSDLLRFNGWVVRSLRAASASE